MRDDCWHSFRRCSCSLFFDSKIVSQCLQEALLQMIWLWLNSRLMEENAAEQTVHLWYSWGICGAGFEVSCAVDLEGSCEAGRGFPNLAVKTFIYLARITSFSWMLWLHVNAWPRRHFESSSVTSTSRYRSAQCRICSANLLISWYRRSSEKSYCSEGSKKARSRDMGVGFWASFWAAFWASFSAASWASSAWMLLIKKHDDKRRICSTKGLSSDSHSVASCPHAIHFTPFEHNECPLYWKPAAASCSNRDVLWDHEVSVTRRSS